MPPCSKRVRQRNRLARLQPSSARYGPLVDTAPPPRPFDAHRTKQRRSPDHRARSSGLSHVTRADPPDGTDRAGGAAVLLSPTHTIVGLATTRLRPEAFAA